MQPQLLSLSQQALSETRRAALITLLADEDPVVYEAVQKTILSCGLAARQWVQPYRLSGDPLLRRRVLGILRHLGRQEADIRFLAFCLNHGVEFDLEKAVLLLGATAYPDLSIQGYGALLDQYAAELRSRIDVSAPARQIAGVINEYLFEELEFLGEERVHCEPDATYFNRVLDRKVGDRINLCLLYLLLARRLRLPMAGVDLPGRFICRYQSASDELYVDVFNCGSFLTKADCVQYLEERTSGYQADLLSPVNPRRLLLRICDNLHQGYLQRQSMDEATRVQRYLVALRA
jgi:regulator of sirC expression with transglutaminase-like and TPR domain